MNFDKIKKALSQLKVATNKDSLNDLERDGVIQRFKYTIEILWKTAKQVLADNGIIAVAPKDVIRELANAGWINNPQELIGYLKMRNESSHSYKEEIAILIYEESKKFVPSCEALIKILEEKSK